MTTLLFMLCFAALGAGNGATFQLVPLRWPITTAVAGGMIGEIGALGGGILPNLLGQSKQHTGSYSLGFTIYAGLAFAILIMMHVVSRGWTRPGSAQAAAHSPRRPQTRSTTTHRPSPHSPETNRIHTQSPGPERMQRSGPGMSRVHLPTKIFYPATVAATTLTSRTSIHHPTTTATICPVDLFATILKPTMVSTSDHSLTKSNCINSVLNQGAASGM